MTRVGLSLATHGGVDEAMFYSYACPAPSGFDGGLIEPSAAYVDNTLGETLLPYGAVRTSNEPAGTLMQFLQSTYKVAADLA